MKIKIFYMLIVLILGISCSIQEVKSDLAEYELKGRVKTLIEKNYDAHDAFGKLQKDNLRDSTIVNFYKNGKFDNIVSYEDGIIVSQKTYQYLSNLSICDDYYHGTLYCTDTTYYNEYGNITTLIKQYRDNVWRYEYKYNDKEQIEECSCYENDELNNKILYYEYDKDGKLLQYKVYNDEGELSRTEYHTYDDEGREIQFLLEDEKGRYGRGEKTSYNGEGFASYVEKDSKYYNWKRYYTYEYDDKGNYIVKSAKFINYMSNKYTESYRLTERTIVYY